MHFSCTSFIGSCQFVTVQLLLRKCTKMFITELPNLPGYLVLLSPVEYVFLMCMKTFYFRKEIQVEFQHINCELDQLIKEIRKLLENIERLPGDDRNTELQGRLTRLSSKLNEYAKQARTRETLSSALVSEEEKIRAKLVTLEEEQVSHFL